MTIRKLMLVAFCVLWLPRVLVAQGSNHAFKWQLPSELSDSTASISFEVDSTWHLVKGTTKSITGRMWLEDPSDQRSLKAEVRVPIANFDTDNSSRDERLREVMHADQSPDVVFSLHAVPDLCSPEQLISAATCNVTLTGELSMSGRKKALSIPAVLTRETNAASRNVQVQGDTVLQWAEFGIEDPSILIAKLAPAVKVSFQILVPLKVSEELDDGGAK